MPEIKPDFSEVVELKPGQYNARITKVDVKKSDRSGAMYLNFMCTVFGSEDEKLNGQNFFYIAPYTGRGAGIFKSFFKDLTGEEVPADMAIDTEDLMGREFTAVLAEETYEGKTRVKVKTTKPLEA
jgi:hypothetical protein